MGVSNFPDTHPLNHRVKLGCNGEHYLDFVGPSAQYVSPHASYVYMATWSIAPG